MPRNNPAAICHCMEVIAFGVFGSFFPGLALGAGLGAAGRLTAQRLLGVAGSSAASLGFTAFALRQEDDSVCPPWLAFPAAVGGLGCAGAAVGGSVGKGARNAYFAIRAYNRAKRR